MGHNRKTAKRVEGIRENRTTLKEQGDIIRHLQKERQRQDDELEVVRKAMTELADQVFARLDELELPAKEKAKRIAGPENIDRLFAEHRLDAIVAPTGGPAWTTDLINGDHFGGGSSSPAAIAGYPNVTVPAGDVHGLPVGISFFGPAWHEPTLLRIAYAFEQATRHRTPPDFVSTLDLT